MKTPISLYLCLSFCVFILGCVKDEQETKPENVLCDGKKGYKSYFPLSVGNQWVYRTSTGFLDTIKIVGYEKINSITYFKAYHRSNNNLNRFFRYDYLGNILEKPYHYLDCVFMPSQCYANQALSWGSTLNSYVDDRMVSDLSINYSTSICNYTNCVKIRYNIGGYECEYYIKRGLGIVYEKIYNNGNPIEYTLISAEIQ